MLSTFIGRDVNFQDMFYRSGGAKATPEIHRHANLECEHRDRERECHAICLIHNNRSLIGGLTYTVHRYNRHSVVQCNGAEFYGLGLCRWHLCINQKLNSTLVKIG